MKSRGWMARLVVVVLPVAAVLLLIIRSDAQQKDVYSQIDLLVDVRHQIVSDYVEEPDQKKMVESAVKAMVDSLDDPYTVYVPPQGIDQFDKQIRGTFVGIGAEVDQVDDRIRIVTPLDDSPAWKAGIMAGDVVLQIGDKSTQGMTIADAIKALQGEEGTLINLKVRHLTGEEAVIPITRSRINVRTVKGVRRGADGKWDFMLDPAHGIGYIRLSQFNEDSARDVRAALDQLRQKGLKGLIFDVRFNPGGLLDTARDIANMFLPSGKRILSVKGRSTPEEVTISNGRGLIEPVPIVVLANESSASASEVLTGALLDNDRAVFIGTRTYGKGSVQQIRALDGDMGAIKITVQYYYLPNGRNIHRRKDNDVWGVDPADGFSVPMTPEEETKMVKIRRQGDVLDSKHMGGEHADVTPEFIKVEMADPQLAAALTALEGKLKDGTWPKVGQSNAQALAMAAKRESLVKQREALHDRLAEVEKEMDKMDHPAATQPATMPANIATTQPAAEGATTQPE